MASQAHKVVKSVASQNPAASELPISMPGCVDDDACGSSHPTSPARGDFAPIVPVDSSASRDSARISAQDSAGEPFTFTRSSDLMRFMAKVPMFQDLPDGLISSLCDTCEDVTFAAGEVIFQQGGLDGFFFVVVDGQVQVLVDGSERRVLSSGDACCDNILKHSEPRQSTGIAKTDVRVLKISKSKMKSNGLFEQLIPLAYTGPKASSNGKGLFFNAETMKDNLRKSMMKPTYNVLDFYSEVGFAQRIARSPVFDNVTHAVIAFNALWIMIDTDYNDAELLVNANPVFIVAENFFCLFFSVELTIRFLSFQQKRHALTDMWFVFDSFLVSMMVLETWVMTIVILALGGASAGTGGVGILRILRLLKLSKMSRMVRLLRMCPELVVLVKGMIAAMRTVVFTFILLAIIVYVFGLTFTQLMKDTPAGDEYFPKVPAAMNSLFLKVVLPDESEIIEAVGEDGWFFKFLILIYTALASLTVMNLLIGVLCEIVTAVSSVEKEAMSVAYVKDTLLSMLEHTGLDANGDHMISMVEFENLLQHPGAASALQEVGVDPIGLVDFTEFIFKDSGDKKLSFSDFMEVVLELRGSNGATVKDVVDLRKLMMEELRKLHSACAKAGAVDTLGARLGSQLASAPAATNGTLAVRRSPPEAAHSESKQQSWANDACTRLTAAASELEAAAGALSQRRQKSQKALSNGAHQ